MNKTYHLIGMGILGSMIAWTLHQRGYPFTWEDNESTICAWKSTTGLIYPSGNEEDMRNYHMWEKWCKGEAPWHLSVTEPGSYWFISKNPPHGGKYAIAQDIGPMRLGEYPSYHLNGQKFVQQTRVFFATRRKPAQPDSQTIVAHGFGRRLHHYVWGWSVYVELEFAKQITNLSPYRPMLYLRKGRFQLGYANLVPGSTYHYAGSSLIVQKQPKMLKIEPKFEWWKRHLTMVTEGLVTIKRIGQAQAGWRPAAAPQDDQYITEQQSIWYILPLWSSGVRYAPSICQAVLQKIEERV